MRWLRRIRGAQPAKNTPIRVHFIVNDTRLRDHLDTTHVDRSTFVDGTWQRQPNSTTRLGLVNLQAVNRLPPDFDVRVLLVTGMTKRVRQSLADDAVVVINQSASPASRRFLTELFAYMATHPPRAKVIFGTELSWITEIEQGDIDARDFATVLEDHLLLRHTARTETSLYADAGAARVHIQEFVIGVDTEVVRSTTPVTQRSSICFVRGPEGRRIKNNEVIPEIIKLIESSETLSDFSTEVLEPPYSSVDFWDAMQRSAAMVMTSHGETFSYVLHDALACGVAVFRPTDMFRNSVHGRLSVDSYPRAGIRYESPEHLLNLLEIVLGDPDRLGAEADRASKYVEDSFSVDALTRSWAALLAGTPLNHETLLIHRGRTTKERADAQAAARRHDAAFWLVPFNDTPAWDNTASMSRVDPDTGIVQVSDYVRRGAGGSHERVRATSAPDETETARALDEAIGFLQLVCRVHRISRIVIGPGLDDQVLVEALASVTTFRDINHGLEPVQIISTTGRRRQRAR